MPHERKPAVVFRAAEIEERAHPFVHPWNPASEMRGAFLGRGAGLRRAGINLIRVPPGKEAFTYHAHLHEEEWLYVISGRALVDSGDATHEVGPGVSRSARGRAGRSQGDSGAGARRQAPRTRSSC